MTGSDNVGSINDIPMPAAIPSSGSEDQEGLSSWTPADYMRLLNVTTAKFLAIILVIAFAIYHSLLHATYGVTPCKGLLKDGMYKGSQWQPWGCMMHKYTRTDSERCFRYNRFWGRRNHLVYIGDSRVRQLYTASRHWIEAGMDQGDIHGGIEYNNHADLSWENSAQNLKLDFIWAPMVNETMHKSLQRWKTGAGPTVIVIGAGAHSINISNGSDTALDEHRRNLTRLKPDLENIVEFGGSKVLWALQAPVNWDRLNGSSKVITNDAIWQYNSQSSKVLTKSNVIVWSSLYRLGEGTLDEMPDGFHMSPIALSKATQMILNLVCNDNMNFNDGSCCKSSDKPTSLQIISFIILGCGLGLTLVVVVYETVCKRHPSHHYQQYHYQALPSPGILNICNLPLNNVTIFLFSLAKLAIIVTYFYICDRTNFFMKENKYFTPINFWLPVLYMTVLGIFFNEESSYTSILHRDQTDEWKGWMQLVILVYHMTGASSSVPIYMHVRVLISAYLFLTGYTHATYFWQKGKTGITRMIQVLFKMNFLTIVLCMCMNRPYQFYFFVPLVSFWYLVLYSTLVCPPIVTAQAVEESPSPVTQYVYLILKYAAVVALVSMMYLSEVFFEKVFVTRPWKALFVTTDDDIHEWWFRWKLDRYSIIYGGVFALIIIVGGKLKMYDDSNHGSLWPKSISIPISLAAIVGLGSYTIFSFICKNKLDCNEVHPYISFVPIVSFTILRNLAGFVRSRYSSFFAWFGKLHVELFIAQYHIWLGADTHGVLVLIPNYPVINVLLTSFIFVCACHEIHSITVQLMPYFVPTDPLLVIRNVIVFILILVPIGIHDGMF